MRRLVFLMAMLAVLVPVARAAVTESAKVKGNGGNPTDGFPATLRVVFLSPPEYVRGCCLDSNSGEWNGPQYSPPGRPSTLGWGSSNSAAPTSAEDAARKALIHDLTQVVNVQPVAVPRVVAGTRVGTIPGVLVFTQGGPGQAGNARTEAAVGFSLTKGVWSASRAVALLPSSDGSASEPVVVQTAGGPVAPSKWNRDQVLATLGSFYVDGSLPPAKVSLKPGTRRVSGLVTDGNSHPVAAAQAVLERKSGSRFRRVAAKTTSGRGAYSFPVRARGVYRVTARLGSFAARSSKRRAG